MIDCLLADMDCLDCSVGACFRERAVQAESVGVSSHSPLMDILRRHPQSVALLEGWSIGFPAAGERPSRALGLDAIWAAVTHQPATSFFTCRPILQYQQTDKNIFRIVPW